MGVKQGAPVNLIIRRVLQMVSDLGVLSIALWVSFLLRFEGDIPQLMLKRLFFLWPYVVVAQYLSLRLAGVHRFSWRYVGLREALHIATTLSIVSAIFLLLRVVAAGAVPSFGYAVYFLLPIGIIIIDWILAILGVLGLRIMRRLISEKMEQVSRRAVAQEVHRTLLIGAGQAGLLIAKELTGRPDLGIEPIGFIDDDAHKRGSMVHGLLVLGTTRELRDICEEKEVQQILITIANIPRSELRKLHELCLKTGLPIKIIPGLYELVEGSVNLSRIRDVTIEDLLGRDPVQLEGQLLAETLQGITVAVTGAGGSIGSEICRQVLKYKPQRIVLIEQAENSLFHIHRELLDRGKEDGVTLLPCIADITDHARMEQLFLEHRPAIVFHAAAHKHVPMMEWNPGEAIKNNIVGTKTVADLAHQYQVHKFVMISTDKAVNPTSVMGCTKRVAELYVQALDRASETQFTTVRFGNVLGSAGSVVPIFKEQLAQGGPITVTHPEMRRFFMTIPEACQLVLQAGAMGAGGEIFILDMGEPVKIVDLAKDLIRLSGLTPEVDIQIEFTGVRPGEKLYEELATDAESANKTKHPKIFIGNTDSGELSEVLAQINALQEAALQGESGLNLRQKLQTIVPEYQGSSESA